MDCLLANDALVYNVLEEGSLVQATILRDAGSLTKEEPQQHNRVVFAGKLKEIRSPSWPRMLQEVVQTHIQEPS